MFLFLFCAEIDSKPAGDVKPANHCGVCHEMYYELHKLDNEQSKQIQEKLFNSCSKHTNGTKIICEVMATQWFDTLLTANDAEKGCKMICDPKGYKEMIRKRPKIQPLGKKRWDCGPCTLVVEFGINAYLGEFLGEEYNPFYEACMQLPSFQDRCYLFTDEKYQLIMNHIFTNLDARDICTAYGIC